MSEKEIKDLQQQIKSLAKVQADANKLQETANKEQTEAIKELREAIQPMVDVYQTFGRLGTWGTRLLKGIILVLTIVSLTLGIIWTFKKGSK